MMGYDVWGGLDSKENYIKGCTAREKFHKGRWYCLENNSVLLSSLIVYRNCLGLPEYHCGVGSIATTPSQRRKGHATQLIKQYIASLKNGNTEGVYLFSDIATIMYSKLGFTMVKKYEEQGLMHLSLTGGRASAIPKYF